MSHDVTMDMDVTGCYKMFTMDMDVTGCYRRTDVTRGSSSSSDN